MNSKIMVKSHAITFPEIKVSLKKNYENDTLKKMYILFYAYENWANLYKTSNNCTTSLLHCTTSLKRTIVQCTWYELQRAFFLTKAFFLEIIKKEK